MYINYAHTLHTLTSSGSTLVAEHRRSPNYGQFSKFQTCFCGLDPGNLKFETVRTNKQRICF